MLKIPAGGSGTSLGSDSTKKVGFHGVAVAQRAGAAQIALTDSTGGSTADATLAAVGATNSGDVSATINANFAKQTVLINELRAALVQKGVIKGSA